jgi:hypothetical protein
LLEGYLLGHQAQRLIHLRCGLKAFFRIEAQGAINHFLQERGKGRIQGAHRLEAERERRRCMPGNHLAQQHPQGENIAARVGVPAPLILFWRGIARCAQRLGVAACLGQVVQPTFPGGRLAVAGGGAGNAKVNHDRPAIRRQDDIGGFEVAKDDCWLLAVKIDEDIAKLAGVIQRFQQRQRRAPACIALHMQALGQSGTFYIIHD